MDYTIIAMCLSFLAGAHEFSSGLVDITRTFEAGPRKSAHYANSNSDLPACITKDPVPKVMPSYQAGHEPNWRPLGLCKISIIIYQKIIYW